MASPLTLKMLRLQYGMNAKAFREMIEPIRDDLFDLASNGKKKKSKKKNLRLLTPKQVKRIKDFLGEPKE